MTGNKKFLKKLEESKAFELCVGDSDELRNKKFSTPYDYFSYFWKKYESFKRKYKAENKKEINNTYNGKIFETIFAFLLDWQEVQIRSMDEKVEGVEFVIPDILIEGKTKTFFLSLKVSARERWKQADWEALKFKKVYPKSMVILVMIEETKSMKKKLPHLRGGLDDVCCANSVELNELVKKIKDSCAKKQKV